MEAEINKEYYRIASAKNYLTQKNEAMKVIEIIENKDPTMINEAGTVTWTGAYQPFGEMLAGSGNVHGFTGKELDAETGLNYFCQRYYDSQIGRFMTLDPIDDKNGISPYAYCSNNPLKFTDPTGEKFSDVEMEEKYWFMRDYGMWKAGFQDYRFLNYDEWGNLIGIDYYSPNSVNNPYLESYIIPPAVYFGISWSNRIYGAYSDKTAFMRCIYALSIASPRVAYYLSGYLQSSVFLGDPTIGMNSALTTNIEGWIQVQFGAHTSLGWLAKNILHEVSHIWGFLNPNLDLGQEYIEEWSKITETGVLFRKYYDSPQDRFAINLIRTSTGPLFRYGILWPDWPTRPSGEGWFLVYRRPYP